MINFCFQQCDTTSRKTWGKHFGIFVLLWTLFPLEIFATSPLQLTDTITKLSIEKYLEILIDPEGQWTLEDIRKPAQASQFQPLDNPNVGLTDTVYWARLTLHNLSPKNLVWFLQYLNTHMDDITLYRPSLDGGAYDSTQVGNIYPLTNRDVRHPSFIFRIESPAKTETTVYFRFNSNGKAMFINGVLWSEKQFLDSSAGLTPFWHAYIGIFTIAISYTLFLFFTLRNTQYLYYASIAFFNVITFLCQTGLDDLWLWEIPGQKGHYGFALALLGSHISQLLFMRSFLQLPNHLPRWDLWGKGFLGFLMLWACCFWWMPRSLHIMLATSFQIPVTGLMMITSFCRYRQQFKPAIFLTIGTLFSFLFMILVMLIIFGVFGDKQWIDIGTAIAKLTIASLLLMALATAYREVLQQQLEAQAEIAQLKATMVDELKRADQLKDEFLANTSHELKTPLHGIIGLCETTTQQLQSTISAKQLENLQLITTSAQRLSSLVGDILDFSKIKNQDLQLQLRSIELQSAIRLAEQLCLPLIGAKPIHLSTNLPKAPIWVQADENRLQQILINLISNAIKFTHEGSVTLSIKQEKEHVTIIVKDTGIGISKEHQTQIFHPFFQADGSISRKYGGTGLGLAVTRQLVQLHQGELHVTSSPNAGATFSFTLPLSPNKAAFSSSLEERSPSVLPKLSFENSPSSETTSPPANQSTLRSPSSSVILVVDDEPLNIKILQDSLSNTGYSVITASDGFQALECLKQQVPHLILLDVMMPRLNGYEVCQQVRQHFNEAQLPIIMQTAKNQIDDHIQGLQAGANDYLTKPFHHEEMLARVQSQLKLTQAINVIKENQRLQWEVERARQIESQLRLSEQRLSRLLDVGNEALLAINEDGNIVYGNKRLETWLNYSINSLKNQSVAQLIPTHKGTHPLEFPWPSGNQATPSLHYQYVALTKGDGKLWEGQMWQTLLELEDPIYVLTLAPLPSEATEAPSVKAPNWLEALNHNRTRLQQLIDILADFHPAKLKSQPLLLKELGAIDTALAQLINYKPPHNPEERFRKTLVEVMNRTLECWSVATQSTAVELAEESGLWKVHAEENRVRARVLERYLEPQKLPKNPRWKTVVRTANFVLSHCTLSLEQQSRLETPLQQLLQLVYQRNLSSS